MNESHQTKNDNPSQNQDHTRVLVPLERPVYEQIKNTLEEFSKNSYAKISVPQFLSRIIKSHWEQDIALLRGIDKYLKEYMSGIDNTDIDPDD